ncbi:MAG: flippase [Cyclobacteriaceae bacterium]
MDLKKVIDQVRNERVFRNFFSLGILQFTNYLVPLITIPYLLRTIGVVNFGQVSLAQAIISYFIIITEYGFNLTATREVSIEKDNSTNVSTIFSNTITTQALLSLLSFACLIVLVYTIPFFISQRILFLNSFLLVIGQILVMSWFFQGIERMKFITCLNLISKSLLLILIIAFIKKPDDYIYVPLFYASGNILSGLISLWIIAKKFHVKYRAPQLRIIVKKLQDGFPVFISSLSVSAYINSNLIILGLFTSEINIGLYSAAEKIMQVVRQLLIVFSQSIYPRICLLAQISHDQVKQFLKTFFLPFSILIISGCLIVGIFSDNIATILIGYHSSTASILIKILIISPAVVCFNIPFYQTLLAYDFRKKYMTVILMGAIVNIILNFILASYFGPVGTAITVVATEVFVTFGLAFSLERLGSRYSLLNLIK